MRIGEIEIGQDYPCRIVAELGTLHHHQGIEGLLSATKDCFNAGADLVKVQLIDPKTAWWASAKQLARYKRLYESFPRKEWNNFLVEANKVGPTFASVFDAETVHEIYDFVPAYKIAYVLNQKPKIISAILGKQKPVIWSTNDITITPTIHIDGGLDVYDADSSSWNIKTLFVQPIYPTPVEKQVVPCMRRYGGFYDGLSYHGSKLSMLCAAIVSGAELLEVHVQSYDADGVDTKFALTMDELKNLVDLRGEYLSSSLSLKLV